MPVVRCAFCQSYVDRDEALRTGVQSFCNRKCWLEYGRASRIPSKAPRRRSKPSKPSKPSIPPETRKSVLRADGGKCRFCLSRGNLHLHHVVYRGQKLGMLEGDHSKHNLLTLCNKCHEEVHGNKRLYQPLCLAVIWLRETRGNKTVTVETVTRYLDRKERK